MAREHQTILVVDDTNEDALLLQDGLRKAGVRNPVRVLSKGEEALHYLAGANSFSDRARHPLPSVLFLDLKLPDTPGIEILKWLSARPELRRMLVIVHSGIQSRREIDELYAAGANTFLRKSNDLNELKELIQYFRPWFEGPQGGRGATAEGRLLEDSEARRAGPVASRLN